MIHDLRDPDFIPPTSADICIVGSGPAGLTLAIEFANSGKRVVVLESGGVEVEARAQELYRSVVKEQPFRGVHEGRFRAFGGTSTRWMGQVLPLMPLDFEQREWVANSGWPISSEALLPYHARAVKFFGIDNWNFDSDLLPRLRRTAPAFDPDCLHFHYSKWCPQPNLGIVHRRQLAQSSAVQVILHANVVDIRLGEGDAGRVEHLRYRTLEGREASLRADIFVLCAGGIETPRLLLASRSQQPKGLGNNHDQVGRYLQDHPLARIGGLVPADPVGIQRLFNQNTHRGQRYVGRFTVAEPLQRQLKLSNASGGILFHASPDSIFDDARALYLALRRGHIGGDTLRAAMRSLHGLGQVGEIVRERLFQRARYMPRAYITMWMFLEQPPDADSRIMLSQTERDELGMPRSEIHWKLGEGEYQALRSYAPVIRAQFKKAGLGEVILAEWIEKGDENWRSALIDQNHHIGTCRMNARPDSGVVDTDCRVHGLTNLYLAGSSVFPTGGHSNPTFTIVALALRLADHLKRQVV